MQFFCNFYSGNSESNIIQSTINKSFLLISSGNHSYKVTELSPAYVFCGDTEEQEIIFAFLLPSLEKEQSEHHF